MLHEIKWDCPAESCDGWLSVNAEIEQLGACLRCGDCIEEEKDGKKPANFGDTRGFIHLKCEVSKKRPINDVLY